MFDFNYNIDENFKDFEEFKCASSINVSSKNPLILEKIAEYATKNEISLGVLIEDSKIWQNNEIKANILYQISAVDGFFASYDLKLENIRLNGILYDKFNSDNEFALIVAESIKQYNPWLNLIIKNYEIKKEIENKIGIKCALEADFNKNSSIRELREMEHTPETVHFEDIECLKRAYDVIKPTPISYNRVAKEL